MDLTSQELLALLPLATAATLASRLVVGWRTIGTFAPALLALTVMQLGARDAGAALLVAGGATLVVSPILDALALPRATRLSVNVVAVIAALVGTGTAAGESSAAPVVVIAIVMERTWDSISVSGTGGAIGLYGRTVGLAFGIAALVASVADRLIAMPWYSAAAIGLALNVAVGSYRGLRLSELRRFRAARRPIDGTGARTGLAAM